MSGHEQNPGHVARQLNGRLDDVMSPESLPGGVPRDLSDRIMARTAPLLRRPPNAVVAFLGPRPAFRLAASILLATMVGLWATLILFTVDATSHYKIKMGLSEVGRDISTVWSASSASIDRELELLSAQLELAQTEGNWEMMGPSGSEQVSDWNLKESTNIPETTF